MTAKSALTHCGHGISYKAPCAECEAAEEQVLAAYERDMGPDECIYRSIYRAMVAAAEPD